MAARVLEPRAEHEPEEVDRHLVVLLVRLLDLERDRRRRSWREEVALPLLAAHPLRDEPPRAVDADRLPEQRIGDVLDHALRFGSGTKTLVRRWYAR